MEHIVLVIAVVITCLLISISFVMYTRRIKDLPTATYTKLVKFEEHVIDMPIANAVSLVPAQFPGWKVKTFDVTNGGHAFQKWLLYASGPIDTVSIQYIRGKVDNVTLGPGEWNHPLAASKPVPNN